MIPSTEILETAQAGFELPINMGAWSEESRCNQMQTAVAVYQRILERMQRETGCQDNNNNSAANAYEEVLKQIWIATFTGGNIYYRA